MLYWRPGDGLGLVFCLMLAFGRQENLHFVRSVQIVPTRRDDKLRARDEAQKSQISSAVKGGTEP